MTDRTWFIRLLQHPARKWSTARGPPVTSV